MPNARMWIALEEGPRLRRILVDFYAEVYRDARLAPFFEHTTIEWAIDHQYAFLAQAFGGLPIYFGDRPRNAHHWMVIDDALFDHREALMERTLRRHGLHEDLIAEWRAFEEKFRSHIVKVAPFPRKRSGEALPFEGYAALDLTTGTLCDECAGELPNGLRVFYHLRTGKLYCKVCKPALYETMIPRE